jgi:hypothetical protein
MKKITIVLFIVVIVCCFFCWILFYGENRNKILNSDKNIQLVDEVDSVSLYTEIGLTFEIIESNNKTWGYKILLNSDTLINQPNKPGLPGNEGFKTKENADKVARLVISKIREGQMPPTVTIEELRELGVL